MKNIRKNSYVVRVYYKSVGQVKVLVLYKKENKTKHFISHPIQR